MMTSRVMLLLTTCLCGMLSAEIVLVSPEVGQVIPLVPENQKAIMAMPSHAERKQALVADKALKKEERRFFTSKAIWGGPLPVTFKWKCTAGEKGPFLLTVSENPDMSNCSFTLIKQMSYAPKYHTLNFKLGGTYYWQVWDQRTKKASVVASFKTEDVAPRWIKVEGRVANMRDLGGWKTADGHRVKQGLLFRGQQLNDNSYMSGKHVGKSRLMVEDVPLLCDTLGIKTDLDLRSPAERAGLKCSPLGEGVKWITIPTESYKDIFTDAGCKSMAQAFKVLADSVNYPIYIHCVGGHDRTGALAFVANGLLGVSEADLAADWEMTSLPYLPDLPGNATNWRDYVGMVKGFDQYGKPEDSLQQKIEAYLLKAGVSAEEIARFRTALVE